MAQTTWISAAIILHFYAPLKATDGDQFSSKGYSYSGTSMGGISTCEITEIYASSLCRTKPFIGRRRKRI
jgi:hypothetical protein